MEQNARTLAVMLDALAQVPAPHAIFGGLAAMLYGKRQRTKDVDMLVPESAFDVLIPALEQRGYAIREHRFLLKMYLPGQPKSVGDMVIAESSATLRAAFMTRVSVQALGQRACAVAPGAFVALQFEASLQSKRLTRDRRRDVYDIAEVLQRGFGPQDEALAWQIAGAMYPGAQAELVRYLDEVRHGHWPRSVLRAQMQTTLFHRHAALALRR